MKKALFFSFLLLFIQATTLPAQAGLLDLSFDGDGMATLPQLGENDAIQAIALQPDGKIVLAGLSSITIPNPPTTHTYFALARLYADGSVDTTFHGGAFYDNFDRGFDRAWNVKIQPDGKILVAGEINTALGAKDYGLARYHPNGLRDSTFGTNGWVATDIVGFEDFAYAMDILPNGKIVLGGLSSYSGNVFHAVLTCYLSNGSLDPTFGNNGIAVLASLPDKVQIEALVALPNNGMVATASYWSQNSREMFVLRLLPNGDLDSTFSGDGYNSHLCNSVLDKYPCMILQPDGKIVVGGSEYVNQLNTLSLARVLPNGDWDSTFGVNGMASFPTIPTVAQGLGIQADGKILIGGQGITGAPTTVHRLYPNGSLDNTYGSNGTGSCDIQPPGNDVIHAALMQPDGKMLVAGKAYTMMAIARFLGGPQVAIEPEKPADLHFTLYPNPVVGSKTVRLSYFQMVEAGVEIQCLDMQGRLLKRVEEEGEAGEQQVEMELPNGLAAGLYWIRLVANGQSAVQKLVVF